VTAREKTSMLVPRLKDEIHVEADAVVGTVVFEASERFEIVRLQVIDEARCVASHQVNPDLANWAKRFLEGYLREHVEAVREKLSLAQKNRQTGALGQALEAH
jgi:hypothetical protein